MRVRIVSSFAATNPDATEFTWEGEVWFTPDSAEPDKTNGALFRLFNVVTEEDAERLESWGYRLPSLSAGDLIVWVGTATTHGRTFIVDGTGFTEVMPGMGIRAAVS